jgi:sulfur carrier protein ThiS
MIVVNGQSSELGAGETVAAVLARLGLAVDVRGVAVAVDGALGLLRARRRRARRGADRNAGGLR